ncbi:MAG TPA: di-heme oxidoredictase family protein [Terriglobales bacterium]|jgi:CxxC motif-containing protein (DUF1111 family)|nr:di-heme oxidoredictase family protein [Terriglobales bacterium]
MKAWKIVALVVLFIVVPGSVALLRSDSATEALTGYSTPTYTENSGTTSIGNGLPGPVGESFTSDQAVFEETDGVDKGLGPIYNAQSCAACHQNPVTGGASQISEFRVGHNNRRGQFVAPTIMINNGQTAVPSRSLVNDRAMCPEAQQTAPSSEDIRTFRMSLSILGDGFVEAIADSTLQGIAKQQRQLSNGRIAGQAIQVPVSEAPGKTAVGRFGWKDQHSSLLSFAADAYLNEQGITSRLQPVDTTTVCKTTTDPEDPTGPDGLGDIDHFAAFMRGTLAPPVDPKAFFTQKAQAGAQIFAQIGCATCHVTSITTAPEGTLVNGGAFTVPKELANKTIHPYSDFLLHDVDTGDGIQQNGPPETANKLRTAPLWGLRTRDRLMHDGLSATRENAILRHGGEARSVTRAFRDLSDRQKDQLLAFINSL